MSVSHLTRSFWLYHPGVLAVYLCLIIFMTASRAEGACQLNQEESAATLILPLRLEIRHNHGYYFRDLLQLALDKTADQYGPCSAALAEVAKPQARLYQELTLKQNAHIIDATAGPERLQQFRAIEFPLLKGLMGYRISFIRPQDQPIFSEVKTIDDLRHLTIGQGEGWMDVEILRLNGFEVITTRDYDSLYRMLKAGRFDFFPRGAHEILNETIIFDTAELAIEQSLILAYPWPVYFFVHKDHHLLAERIEAGLKLAREDGSFDHFFNTHPLSHDTFQELNLDQRRIIYLCNPIHSDPALLSQPHLWIKPWPLQAQCTWRDTPALTSRVAQ